MKQPDQVTDTLIGIAEGTLPAETLSPLIYAELRRLARVYLARENPGHTLQPTDLVHEAYLRLIDQDRVDWKGRAHFLGIAALSIRRILIDHARRRRHRQRSSGQAGPPRGVDVTLSRESPVTDLLALDQALAKLAGIEPLAARIVELRFFGGLTETESAEVLDVSSRTIRRHWQFAKAWIYRDLTQNPTPTGHGDSTDLAPKG